MANYQNTPGKSWIMTFGILKIIFGLFSVVVMLTSPSLPSFKLLESYYTALKLSLAF